MRARLAFVFVLVFSATSLFAKEVWIAASGTANGVFFSDARVFNPNDKDITIQAFYLPRGNGNNSGEQPTSFTVTKRQMRAFDDIVATLLHRSDVGAIRFVCPDDFIVTQRVYLSSTTACAPGGANPCTLGQFVNGVDVTDALTKGIILQLKSNPKFRANIGATNTTGTAAQITWKLYDKNNAVVATKTETLQPFGVLGPSEFAGYLGAGAGADLNDAWVGFTSDQPIIAYGSVVDNSSGDQTYIPASFDSGTSPAPAPQTVVTITAQDFEYKTTVSGALRAGEPVTLRVSATEGVHGFSLVDPNGHSITPQVTLLNSTVIERTIIFETEGTYTFFCTNTLCGEGHIEMVGELSVGQASGPGDPPRY